MGPSGDIYTLRHISKNLTLISLICMFSGELLPNWTNSASNYIAEHISEKL